MPDIIAHHVFATPLWTGTLDPLVEGAEALSSEVDRLAARSGDRGGSRDWTVRLEPAPNAIWRIVGDTLAAIGVGLVADLPSTARIGGPLAVRVRVMPVAAAPSPGGQVRMDRRHTRSLLTAVYDPHQTGSSDFTGV